MTKNCVAHQIWLVFALYYILALFFGADEALPKMPSVYSAARLCLAKRECALSNVTVVASHEC